MNILVVSPHRDDAAFSLGLAIRYWLQAGHGVDVLACFTRSKYAPFIADGLLHPHDELSHVTALRLREDELWARSCGKGLRLLDLNLKDAPIRLRCELDRVCTLQPVAGEKAMLKIEKAIAQRCADTLVVLPLAIGNHVDHLCAREAGLQALPKGHACAFYEDLPYSARSGAKEQLREYISSANPPLRPAFASVSEPGEHAVAQKHRIVLCYDSQVDDETTWQIARHAARYGGRERLWANQAALSTSCLCAGDETTAVPASDHREDAAPAQQPATSRLAVPSRTEGSGREDEQVLRK